MDTTARALVLDDNQNMRFMLSEMLRAIGFGDVFEAATCDQAREQLDARSYTIMFADIGLRHETSLGLIREMRAHHTPAIATLPIIVISGQNIANVVIEAREAGASAFLAKPFSVAGLTERIGAALRRSPAETPAANTSSADSDVGV